MMLDKRDADKQSARRNSPLPDLQERKPFSRAWRATSKDAHVRAASRLNRVRCHGTHIYLTLLQKPSRQDRTIPNPNLERTQRVSSFYRSSHESCAIPKTHPVREPFNRRMYQPVRNLIRSTYSRSVEGTWCNRNALVGLPPNTTTSHGGRILGHKEVPVPPKQLQLSRRSSRGRSLRQQTPSVPHNTPQIDLHRPV